MEWEASCSTCIGSSTRGSWKYKKFCKHPRGANKIVFRLIWMASKMKYCGCKNRTINELKNIMNPQSNRKKERTVGLGIKWTWRSDEPKNVISTLNVFIFDNLTFPSWIFFKNLPYVPREEWKDPSSRRERKKFEMHPTMNAVHSKHTKNDTLEQPVISSSSSSSFNVYVLPRLIKGMDGCFPTA